MIGLTLWLITERALLGRRRRFDVNMGFSDEYQILMENLYVFKLSKNVLKIF